MSGPERDEACCLAIAVRVAETCESRGRQRSTRLAASDCNRASAPIEPESRDLCLRGVIRYVSRSAPQAFPFGALPNPPLVLNIDT